MSEDAAIRRKNLAGLKYSATELTQKVGSTYQYWRDMLDGKKSFGEKVARRIEAALGLKRGCLDDIDGCKHHKAVQPEPPAQTRQDDQPRLSSEALILGRRLDKIGDDGIKGAALAMALQVVQNHYLIWKSGDQPEDATEPDPPRGRKPRSSRQIEK